MDEVPGQRRNIVAVHEYHGQYRNTLSSAGIHWIVQEYIGHIRSTGGTTRIPTRPRKHVRSTRPTTSTKKESHRLKGWDSAFMR